MPKARMMPALNVVFPLPSGPVRSRMSPGRSRRASARAQRRVSAGVASIMESEAIVRYDSIMQIASEEKREQFEAKMHDLQRKEQEHFIEMRAKKLDLGYISLRGFPIEPETLVLIPQDKAFELRAICFFRRGNEMRIGVEDPERPGLHELIDHLKSEQRAHIALYLISETSFLWAFRLYKNISSRHDSRPGGVDIPPEALKKYAESLTTLADVGETLKRGSATELLTIILAGALKTGASDIHLEAEERDVKIRYRIDGVLQTVAVLGQETQQKIGNRIKLLAGLKINVLNQPQDGRVTLHTEDESFDVRVSTIPSSYGESIVLRLLLSVASGLSLDTLGFRGKAFRELTQQSKRPNGLVITTGPSSSGKTTTLYALLKTINTPDRKIVTLEDPVEYRLPGINQSQIDPGHDYTFSKGLKAVLRQNPDIVMVGEIRDSETADIAIHAALTGHQVLSSLHTNNAAGAIPRFLALGVEPYLLTPALNVVIAQRLLRRICEKCKEPFMPAPEIIERAKAILAAISEKAEEERRDIATMRLFHGKGCEACHGIGLKGRIGIFEVLVMTPDIEKLVMGGDISESVLEKAATADGMVTMVQDGILKALDGITTLDEVFRVAAEE